MRTEKVNGHTIVLYEGDIHSLPVKRFVEFNRAVALDYGIGSDWDSLDNHLVYIAQIMKTDIPAAEQEIINCRGNFQFMLNNINPKLLSLVPFIYSLDGRVLTDEDMTDDGKQLVLKEINDVKYGWFIETLAVLKKKVDEGFSTFFPDISESGGIREYYTKLKQKIDFQIDRILGKDDLETRIQALDRAILSMNPPKVFTGYNGVEVQMIAGFEDSCQLLQQLKIEFNPRSLSTFSFYRAIENARKQLEKSK